MKEKVKVLFVCMGNICRSPTAEGVFTQLLKDEGLTDHVEVDSAGTHDYHVGKTPDRRAQETALRRGIDLSGLRARVVDSGDFFVFDYVLAMDRENHADLSALCPKGQEHKLRMFLDFAADLGEVDVPDPYYGGAGGFERVVDMVDQAARGLLAEIRTSYGFS